METKVLDFIDFEKVNLLLEGFNKLTGFVTAILDLEGNVLSKSGWRQICTDFHRINHETSRQCTFSDTVLANKMGDGEKYHFYECLNGLVDVAVPIVINGEHIANLFSGQFFFQKPNLTFFIKQAEKYGFDEKKYLKALKKVPVVSKEKVLAAMDYLLNMTQLISEMTFKKLEQMELNEVIRKNEHILRLYVEHSPASIAMFDNNMRYLVASRRFLSDYNLGSQNLIGRSHYEVFPEISERWKEYHRRGLSGETLKENNDPFPRADGSTDWVRWEIRPWYESEKEIGGIILFSEVITSQIEDREALRESEKYNRMLFEQSAIGLALTSLEGKLVDINTTFLNIIGRTAEEAKTMTYWDLTPEKYKNQEEVQLDLLYKTGHYGPYEKEYIHRDGHLVPVRLQGLVIERNNEKFIWSSVEDISALKLKTEALQISRERLDFALNQSHTGGWELDLIDHTAFRTLQHDQIFGYKTLLPEWTYEMFLEHVIPEDQQEVDRLFKLAVKNKSDWNFTCRIFRKDGEIRWIWAAGGHQPDLSGNIRKMAGIVQDITEQKKVELEQARLLDSEKAALTEANKVKEQLYETNEYLENLFNYANAPIIVWDNFFRITRFNRAFENLCGYTASDVIGRQIGFLFPPEKVQSSLQLIQKTTSGERWETIEIDFLRKDQTIRTVLWNSANILDQKENRIIATIAQGHDITERKLAEGKIRENSSLIRIAAEKAKLGGWNVDLKENRVYWSDQVAAIHEMPPGYAPFVEDGINFYAPEWRESIIKAFTDCAQTGVPYDEEMEIITSTGKRVWVRTIGEAVYDENGKIVKVEGAFQDISERKISEAKNREKDLQFRKLSANVPDLIFQFTRKPDGTYCVPVASEGIKNIFGCSPEDVVDDFTPIGKVIYPEDSERVIADIEYSAKYLTYFTCEFRVQIPGKPVQWIFSRSTPEKLPDGSITWYGFNADITKRKEFEEALRESEEKYRSIYENSSVAILLTATDGTILSANDFACRIFGRNEAEICLAGRNGLLDLTDPRLPAMLDERKKSGKVKGELTFLKKDGTRFPGEISSVVFTDHEGNERTSMVIRDMTEQKRAEAEVKALTQTLEQKVTDRTAQLQAVNKELETFTYSVSHDLKAPLRGIDGYSKLLSDLHANDLSEEAKLFISTIRKSTHQMSQLIDDLLQYSRLERSQLRSEPVMIKSFVNSILKVHEDEITSGGFSVVTNIPETPIIADSNGIQTALRNLIENAIKFTKSVPEPAIEIILTESASSWLISVKDNGIGFDMKYSQRIFEIFQRLHRVEDYPGTGIGLAMVGKAMQRMNGRVWAESKPGKGAVFYLEIPKPV